MTKNNGAVTTAPNEGAEAKRINGLITKAVKHIREASTSLQEAGAAAAYQLIAYGNNTYINRLYLELANEKTGSPMAANALRAFFVRGIVDKFGKGGEMAKDEETGLDKWVHRNVNFIDFSPKVDQNTGIFKGFTLVNVKNNDRLSEHDIKCIKEAKQDIVKAGEKALDFPWLSAAQEFAMAKVWNDEAIARSARTLLMNVARNATQNSISVNELLQAGRALGMADDKLTDVKNAYTNAKAAAKEEQPTKPTKAKSELIPVQNGKGAPAPAGEAANA